MKRKKFLQSLGLLSGGLAIGSIQNLYGADSHWATSLNKCANEDDFWKIIREQFVFPRDYTYLNTGGIGAVPSLVINKVVNSLNEMEKYPKPGHNHDNWEQVKKSCTQFFGPACKASELALISCATEGINIILNGIGLKDGDEVITSTHEHPALHVPLLNHHRHTKIQIKTFEPDRESASGNVKKIAHLITRKTRLIILSHVTCATGQVFPLKEIGELARNKGITFAVDGAQAPGGIAMDLRKMNVDFYTCSGHKWLLGPKRTGILYVPEEQLEYLRPTTVGAYSDKGYDMKTRTLHYQDTAQRYEFGTQNEALFTGLGAGANFISTIGIDRVQKHNTELAEAFYKGVKSLKGTEVISPLESEYRSSIISFKIPGKKAQDIANYLSSKGRIRVRVVNEAGLNAVRASFHVCNQQFEVDHLLNTINEYLNQ